MIYVPVAQQERTKVNQASKMKSFMKIVNGLKPSTNFAKHSILDV